jgi:hypothetical protein
LKHKTFAVLVLIGALGAGSAVLISVLMIVPSRQKSAAYFKAEDIEPFLNDGDILCRLGDRFWSVLFKDISIQDKRFSHLGIVHIDSGNITVINAEGLAMEGKDSVNEVSLQEFLDIARAIGVYQLKDIEGKLVADTAAEFKGRKFDWQFDLSQDDSLYCSELLYVVLKKIAPDITLQTIYHKEIGREIIPLEACSNSAYFNEVYYSKIK